MPLVNDTRRVYLDYNSTTPCASEVIAEMLPYFTQEYGNAASPHVAGRVASAAVAQAREEVARAVGTNSRCVLFTSGATESNNLALFGVVKSGSRRRKIVVSVIEHKSVLEPCLRLLDEGYILERIPVDRFGVVDLESAANLIDDRTLIVSVQGANNETGVLQPVREIAQLAHDRGALCHCDAAQMLGKLPVRVEELDIDLASFSAHKAYGPKGIGALFLAEGKVRSVLKPILSGGGQESGIRPGTQNVPGIVGFGCACRLVHGVLDAEIQRVSAFKHLCEKELLRGIPGSFVNGRTVPRLPGTISLTIPGVPADMLIANLTKVCISNGSACNSGAPEPSHVLLAMKLSRSDAECTVRISLGRHTSKPEIMEGCREMITTARELRVNLGIGTDLPQSNGSNA
jgi:cysteine desulfurase